MTASLKRHPRTLSAFAIGAATLVFAACGSSDGGSDATSDAASAPAAASDDASSPAAAGGDLPKTIVFSPVSLAPPALKGLSEGLKGYAGGQGWEVIVQDPNFDPTTQVQQLTEVLQSGRAGAAWVIAVAPPSMAPVIEAAQGGGIPILVNGKPEEYGFDGPQPGITFDYIDYEAAGTALGENLGKCLTEKNGGSGKVFFAVSTEGQAGKEEFESAAKAALVAAAPGAEIVQEIITADRTAGQTDISAALQGNPDVVGIMSTQDEGTLGAIGAFAAAGKDLTCNANFGGNEEVLGLVKTGEVYASVALQFEADLAQAFDTLVTMQADPTAPGDILVVPQKVITATS